MDDRVTNRIVACFLGAYVALGLLAAIIAMAIGAEPSEWLKLTGTAALGGLLTAWNISVVQQRKPPDNGKPPPGA